jgi:hypothetical protein
VPHHNKTHQAASRKFLITIIVFAKEENYRSKNSGKQLLKVKIMEL